ncbi:MAG TPA: winged helix-turn-helix domain-containing protein [Candidatus Angelobacter sp.]|nr:winged helix-turn-helix domain-containing protein [Candidatus Angelobacter sp.]
MSSPSPQPAVRFGSFEVNPRTGELRKQGIRIKLHEKPFQLLLALLEHPGEVVTRKELQERLWPSDTFVEFENGLNNAISRLREVLGDTAESPRFIETVPRRGYRFLPEVSPAMPASRAANFRPWLVVFGSVLGVSLVIGAVFRLPTSHNPVIRSLAVLPFRNLGAGTSDEYFTDGMTDAVTTELAKLGVSKVISETSVAQFKDTKKSVPDIARTLDVDAVVEGAVLRDGNRVRITVQLIGADTDRHLWADSYERQMTDILALQDEVALGVAHAIKLELSPGAPGRPASPKPVNTDAYEAYLKGRYFMQKSDESFLRAKDYFQQAIQLDPTYAPAYAGLSDFYVLALPPKEALPKAKEYAEQALKLDSNLPDSHISLAYIYFYDDWNWPAAGQEFKQAIALAPGLAPSHRWYAVYLAAMGRMAEAMSEAQRAVDLDPLSISAHHGAAVAAVSAGQYDRSIAEGRKILELDANDPRAYLDMAAGNSQKGMYPEALQDAEKGITLSHRDPFFLSIAAFVYGRLGNIEQAGKLVEEMRAASKKSFVGPFLFATAFVGMGKQKEAMAALEEGYKARDPDIVGLNSTPWFAPLRSDPRFQDLLRRMNFPAEK